MVGKRSVFLQTVINVVEFLSLWIFFVDAQSFFCKKEIEEKRLETNREFREFVLEEDDVCGGTSDDRLGQQRPALAAMGYHGSSS